MIEIFNDIIQALGIISAMFFSVVSIIVSYRDKLETRKPILYVFPQENDMLYDTTQKVHIWGEFGIKLGIHIINIGGGLAKNISLLWYYQGELIKENSIKYLCAKDEQISYARVYLPEIYAAMITRLLTSKADTKIKNLLDDLDDLELKIIFLDTGKVKYKKKVRVKVVARAVYCRDNYNPDYSIQNVHLIVQTEEV